MGWASIRVLHSLESASTAIALAYFKSPLSIYFLAVGETMSPVMIGVEPPTEWLNRIQWSRLTKVALGKDNVPNTKPSTERELTTYLCRAFHRSQEMRRFIGIGHGYAQPFIFDKSNDMVS